MTAVKQTIVDKGWNSYIGQLENAPKNIKIGVLADSADNMSEDGDITLYEKAIKNEFGLGVPKRPFMRISFDLHEKELMDAAKKMDDAVFQQALTLDQAMQRLGQMHQSHIQEVIANGRRHFQLNSVQWSEIKGGTPSTVTPLIYTGQLRQSINFKVE